MENDRKYKLEKLKSASDLEALIMLYDEIVVALEEAKIALGKESNHNRCIEKIEWVEKAISGLISILNFDVDRSLANNLFRIYDYILRRLVVAKSMIRQTPSIIEEVIKLVSVLRDAWVKVKEKGDITESFKLNLTTEEKSFLNIEI